MYLIITSGLTSAAIASIRSGVNSNILALIRKRKMVLGSPGLCRRASAWTRGDICIMTILYLLKVVNINSIT